MRRTLAAALLLLALGCGADSKTAAKLSDLQTRNDDLNQQVTKLEKRLDDVDKQIVAQQQTMQAMNDRLKTAEAYIDKLTAAQTQR